MSVTQTHYVMIGFCLDEDEVKEFYKQNPECHEDGEISKYEEGHNGLNLIYDGMCGQYIAFGYIVEQADEFEGLPMTALVTSISQTLGAEKAANLKRTASKLFNMQFDFCHIQYLAFTHRT